MQELGFSRCVDFLNALLTYIAGVMLAVASCAVLTQIVVRSVFPTLGLAMTVTWTDELARYLITWSVFLGLAVLSRRGGLIAITALIDSVPGRISLALQLASSLATALFFAILAVIGGKWAFYAINETATVMRIPMALVYASMPIGSVIAIVNLVLHVRDLVMSRNDHKGLSYEGSRET